MCLAWYCTAAITPLIDDATIKGDVPQTRRGVASIASETQLAKAAQGASALCLVVGPSPRAFDFEALKREDDPPTGHGAGLGLGFNVQGLGCSGRKTWTYMLTVVTVFIAFINVLEYPSPRDCTRQPGLPQSNPLQHRTHWLDCMRN